MSGITIYRIQDKEGRGPFKPGFSKVWSDDDFALGVKAHPTWMQEFGSDLIAKNGKPGNHWGSGLRTIEKLNEWFSKAEQARLAQLGYNVVSMQIDRILAESENQLVFERARPLHKHVVIVPWKIAA